MSSSVDHNVNRYNFSKNERHSIQLALLRFTQVIIPILVPRDIVAFKNLLRLALGKETKIFQSLLINLLIIHMLLTQLACISWVRCMYIDTQ